MISPHKPDHRRRVGVERSQKTRAHILESAVGVFALKGAHAPVIDDFVRAAGISRGTFYNYFDTTHALLHATIEWLEDDVFGSMEPEAAAIPDVALRLGTATRMYLRWAAAHRRWCAFVTHVPQIGTLARRRLLRDLRDGQKSGVFRFPHVQAAHDLAAGIVAQAVQRMAATPRAAARTDEVVHVMLQGLGVNPAELQRVMAASIPVSARPAKSASLFKTGSND